jgi:hypothetical protein
LYLLGLLAFGHTEAVRKTDNLIPASEQPENVRSGERKSGLAGEYLENQAEWILA